MMLNRIHFFSDKKHFRRDLSGEFLKEFVSKPNRGEKEDKLRGFFVATALIFSLCHTGKSNSKPLSHLSLIRIT